MMALTRCFSFDNVKSREMIEISANRNCMAEPRPTEVKEKRIACNV